MSHLNLYRIIDANINRVAEGIRVLEDVSRFVAEDTRTTEKLKDLRHRVRKSFSHPDLIRHRNSQDDLGLAISSGTAWDKKESVQSMVAANFKRVQEGLRSIEECLKVGGYDHESKVYETLRFKAYDLEKHFLLNRALLDTDIYGITGEEFSAGKSNVQLAKEMIAADIRIIQYRDKNKTKLEKFRQCEAIRKLTRQAKVTFIVNDDLDIALAVGADGVHLGQEDLPVTRVREIVGNMLIGVSTHNREQAQNALENGADYIGVGPIFQTSTKKNPEKSQGLNYLKWVAENIPVPYVAIGGIKETNILQVKKHGGKCYAMISELAGAASIKDKVSAIRRLLA